MYYTSSISHDPFNVRQTNVEFLIFIVLFFKKNFQKKEKIKINKTLLNLQDKLCQRQSTSQPRHTRRSADDTLLRSV